MDVQLDTDPLLKVGKLLREFGDKDFRSRILKSLRAPATKTAAAQRSAVRALGGAAPSDWKAEAAKNVRVDAILTGSNPRIAVRYRRGSTSRKGWLLNRGEWTHPTFGRPPEVTQKVEPGWFDTVALRMRPETIRATANELDAAVRELATRIDAVA